MASSPTDIKVVCTNGHHLRVNVKHAGKTVKCPECGVVIVIPVIQSIEPPLPSNTALPPPIPESTSSNTSASIDTNYPAVDSSTLPFSKVAIITAIALTLELRFISMG